MINSYFATLILLCSAILFADTGHIDAQTQLVEKTYNSSGAETDEVDADPSLDTIASAPQVSDSHLPSAKSQAGLEAALSTSSLTPKQRAPPVKNVR